MSHSYKEKLALVICTKDRPQELAVLMKSIEQQNVHPFEIIIVDGGTKTVKHIAEEYSRLNTKYLTLRPPSLTRQRNLGIRNLSNESTLVGFIDDDLVFQPETIQKMLEFWETASKEVGGVSFNITNYHLTKIPKIKSWFLLDGKQKGILLPSGVATAYFPADKDEEVEWLCGGATVWRREIFKEQLFDTFYYELGWNEDVDFSYAASRKYRLMVASKAKVIHTESQTSRINNFCFGQIQSVHRLYFVRKYHEKFSILACYWACFGQMLTNLMKGITEFNRDLCVRAFGNIFGMTRFLIGKASIYVSKTK